MTPFSLEIAKDRPTDVDSGRNRADFESWESVAWVKRCPNPMPGPSEIEIRPLYEMADLR